MKAPILDVFNKVDKQVIQWCTPSIYLGVRQAKNIYANDVSCSYHKLGNFSNNTGIFKEAHELASKAYGSDKTIFCVNGSTGSNFITLRALKKQLGHIKLLSTRNVHKSVSVAIEDYGIEVNYLPINYNDDKQIFLPNSEKTICEYVAKIKPNVLLITNPTYEGLSLNLENLIKKIRKINKKLIIYVDEAWGAHFGFSNLMPQSAMKSGADICVQSTHKQGSGLQQTSMIHWKTKRIKSENVYQASTELTTTSPSYHLLASLDGARELMETKGSEIIAKSVELSNIFRDKLNHIDGVRAYYSEKMGFACDPTKILVNLENQSAIALAHNLEIKHKIIVEKYESKNFILIMKFQNGMKEIKKTIKAIRQELKQIPAVQLNFPKFPSEIIKKKDIYDLKDTEMIGLKRSVGRVCAENVVPYPPGIALVAKGELIQQAHIDYLKAIKKTNGLITVLMENKNKIRIER